MAEPMVRMYDWTYIVFSDGVRLMGRTEGHPSHSVTPHHPVITSPVKTVGRTGRKVQTDTGTWYTLEDGDYPGLLEAVEAYLERTESVS